MTDHDRFLSLEQSCLLYSFLPHYDVVVRGPLGVTFKIELIIQPDAQAAMESVKLHIQSYCEAHSYPFDADEWFLMSIQAVNQN
jgi:hypothetical protein